MGATPTISNTLTPQQGLISTNPFLSGPAPTTGGTTTAATAPTSTFLNQSAQTATSPAPLVTQPIPTAINFGAIAPPSSTMSTGGSSYAPTSSTASSAPTQSVYQQNLAKYGLTSIPAGYSFNANGTLTNNAGQEYVAPSSTPPTTGPTPAQTAAATYSGGVNSTGGTIPGYVPVPQINAPGNPNTATGSTFNNDVGTESQIAAQPSAAFTAAQTQYNQANTELAALQQDAATQNANILGGRTNLQESGGEQGLLGLQLAGQEAPLTGEMTAAAAQEAAATGQQGTQQAGLGQAAGLVAPQPGQSPATQAFNPATGTYSPLAATSAGTAGETGAQALESLGTTLGAEGAGANLVPLKQALDGGATAAANINSYLASNPSLNSSSLNLANLASQWASGQYSGANAAQYQTLGDYLTTFATQMAPLLAPTGNATDASNALQRSLINGSSSGMTISQVLAQLTAEAQATYNTRASGGAGGGPVGGGSGTTSVPGGTNPPATTFSQNFFSS